MSISETTPSFVGEMQLFVEDRWMVAEDPPTGYDPRKLKGARIPQTNSKSDT